MSWGCLQTRNDAFNTCCGTKECVKDVWHVRNNMLKVLR